MARRGPDRVDTTYLFNKQDRVSYVRKGPASGTWNGPVYEATYTYFDNGMVERIDYGNGTATEFGYDHLNWVTDIDHIGTESITFFWREYQYSDTGLPELVIEYGYLGEIARTAYVYKNRGRLIKEERTDTVTGPASGRTSAVNWAVGC